MVEKIKSGNGRKTPSPPWRGKPIWDGGRRSGKSPALFDRGKSPSEQAAYYRVAAWYQVLDLLSRDAVRTRLWSRQSGHAAYRRRHFFRGQRSAEPFWVFQRL